MSPVEHRASAAEQQTTGSSEWKNTGLGAAKDPVTATAPASLSDPGSTPAVSAVAPAQRAQPRRNEPQLNTISATDSVIAG